MLIRIFVVQETEICGWTSKSRIYSGSILHNNYTRHDWRFGVANSIDFSSLVSLEWCHFMGLEPSDQFNIHWSPRKYHLPTLYNQFMRVFFSGVNFESIGGFQRFSCSHQQIWFEFVIILFPIFDDLFGFSTISYFKVPIIYFFNGRSLSRHKQSFFIYLVSYWNISSSELT